MEQHITIALVDDHDLLREALAKEITKLGYTVLFQSKDGKEFIKRVEQKCVPDVVLMDIDMRPMNGFDTTHWLKINCPEVRVLALSMFQDESAIIRMLRNGAKGYISKEVKIEELKKAIDSVYTRGYYFSEMVTGKVVHSIQRTDAPPDFSERQLEFLKYICTELTYKEIADLMHISPRTVDGYRDELFIKTNAKSRVGLVMFAIKKSNCGCLIGCLRNKHRYQKIGLHNIQATVLNTLICFLSFQIHKLYL